MICLARCRSAVCASGVARFERQLAVLEPAAKRRRVEVQHSSNNNNNNNKISPRAGFVRPITSRRRPRPTPVTSGVQAAAEAAQEQSGLPPLHQWVLPETELERIGLKKIEEVVGPKSSIVAATSFYRVNSDYRRLVGSFIQALHEGTSPAEHLQHQRSIGKYMKDRSSLTTFRATSWDAQISGNDHIFKLREPMCEYTDAQLGTLFRQQAKLYLIQLDDWDGLQYVISTASSFLALAVLLGDATAALLLHRLDTMNQSQLRGATIANPSVARTTLERLVLQTDPSLDAGDMGPLDTPSWLFLDAYCNFKYRQVSQPHVPALVGTLATIAIHAHEQIDYATKPGGDPGDHTLLEPTEQLYDNLQRTRPAAVAFLDLHQKLASIAPQEAQQPQIQEQHNKFQYHAALLYNHPQSSYTVATSLSIEQRYTASWLQLMTAAAHQNIADSNWLLANYYLQKLRWLSPGDNPVAESPLSASKESPIAHAYLRSAIKTEPLRSFKNTCSAAASLYKLHGQSDMALQFLEYALESLRHRQAPPRLVKDFQIRVDEFKKNLGGWSDENILKAAVKAKFLFDLPAKDKMPRAMSWLSKLSPF